LQTVAEPTFAANGRICGVRSFRCGIAPPAPQAAASRISVHDQVIIKINRTITFTAYAGVNQYKNDAAGNPVMAYALSGLFIFAVLPSTSVLVIWAEAGGLVAVILALLMSPAWLSAALCVSSLFEKPAAPALSR
jgi:hypothetical protein